MAANDVDPYLPVAVLKVLSAHTKERYEQARIDAHSDLGAGDRRIVRSPLDGAKIGAVYMTDPKPVAVVIDEDALLAWLAEHEYADQYETVTTVDASDPRVLDVLFTHAPDLIRSKRRVKPEARRDLLERAARLGAAIGPSDELDVPGIQVRRGESYVACKPDDDGLLAVYELINSGRVMLDGTVRPELEATDG